MHRKVQAPFFLSASSIKAEHDLMINREFQCTLNRNGILFGERLGEEEVILKPDKASLDSLARIDLCEC
jgi:hypothetical protein